MSDRKLLELAAKAAGISLEWDGPPDKWQPMYYQGKTYHSFDPLTDDGDALRLAVRLRLHARQFPVLDDGMDEPLGMVEVWRTDDNYPLHVELLRRGDDRLAVTRLAYTHAAAEIGKVMP